MSNFSFEAHSPDSVVARVKVSEGFSSFKKERLNLIDPIFRGGGSALKRGRHSRPRGPLCNVAVGHAFCTVGTAQ